MDNSLIFCILDSMEKDKYTWRTVPNFSNYEISIDTEEGLCRNKTTGKILSNRTNKNGRKYWCLVSNKEERRYQAARWIALTYPELIQNEWFEGAEIDHINGNKFDNRPQNLRWVTHKENMNNINTREQRSALLTGRKLTEETKKKLRKPHSNGRGVIQYSLKGSFVKKYHSLDQVVKQNKEKNFQKGNIGSVCRGKRKTAYGFIWRYAV